MDVRLARASLVCCALTLTLALVGCSGARNGAAPATRQAGKLPPKTVNIRDFSFEPAEMEVLQGTTVRWINEDAVPHTVQSDTGVFGSRIIYTGKAYSFTFSKKGTYTYKCSIHQVMVGQIIVK